MLSIAGKAHLLRQIEEVERHCPGWIQYLSYIDCAGLLLIPLFLSTGLIAINTYGLYLSPLRPRQLLFVIHSATISFLVCCSFVPISIWLAKILYPQHRTWQARRISGPIIFSICFELALWVALLATLSVFRLTIPRPVISVIHAKNLLLHEQNITFADLHGLLISPPGKTSYLLPPPSEQYAPSKFTPPCDNVHECWNAFHMAGNESVIQGECVNNYCGSMQDGYYTKLDEQARSLLTRELWSDAVEPSGTRYIEATLPQAVVEYSCFSTTVDLSSRDDLLALDDLFFDFGPDFEYLNTAISLSSIRNGTFLQPLSDFHNQENFLFYPPETYQSRHSLLLTQLGTRQREYEDESTWRTAVDFNSCVINAFWDTADVVLSRNRSVARSTLRKKFSTTGHAVIPIPVEWIQDLYRLYTDKARVFGDPIDIDARLVQYISLLLSHGLSSLAQVSRIWSSANAAGQFQSPLPWGLPDVMSHPWRSHDTLADEMKEEENTPTKPRRYIITVNEEGYGFGVTTLRDHLALTFLVVYNVVALLRLMASATPKSNSKAAYLRLTHVFSSRGSIGSRLSRWFRPRLQQGMTRVEWTCSCGQALYGDFKEHVPGSLEVLRHQLDELYSSAPDSSQESKRSKQQSTQNTVSIISTKPPEPQSYCGGTAGSQSRDNARDILCTYPVRGIPMQGGIKFLEVSMPGKGGFHRVTEVVCGRGSNSTDRTVFGQIRQGYEQHRRSSLAWRLSLHKPVGASFTRMQVFQHLIVSIVKIEPCFPPKVEVDEGRYEYSPVPMNEPAMPANVFLHYLNNDNEAHNTFVWTARLPYRLGKPLAYGNHATTSFWGVEIEEGPNRLIFGCLMIAALVVSGIVAAVYGVCTRDAPTSVAIGTWLTAIQSIAIALLFYRYPESLF